MNSQIDPTQDFNAIIGAIRQRLQSLAADRTKLDRKLPTLAEADAAIDRFIDDQAENFRRSHRGLLASLRNAEDPRAEEISPFQLAAVLDPDHMKVVLSAEVRARDDSAGISRAARKKAEADIAADMLQANIEEEHLLRQAAEVGIAIARRVDADPRAVLGD